MRSKIILGIKEQYKELLGIIIFLAIGCIPFILTAFWMVPVDDDFGNAHAVFAEGGMCLSSAVRLTINTYLTWQGTYTGSFLIYFLNPIGNAGILGVRIMGVIGVLLLTLSFFNFVNCICVYILDLERNKYYPILIAAILLFVILNTRSPMELFYFNTVNAMYEIPFAFAFFSVGAIIKLIFSNTTSYKVEIVVALAMGILACGGTLQITAYVCYAALILLLYSFFYKKERFSVALKIFICLLIFALINALAPGGFNRFSYKEGNLSIVKAIYYSVIIFLVECKYIIWSAYTGIYLVILFGVLYNTLPQYKKSFFIHPITVLLLSVSCAIISNFPIALSKGSTYMDGRNYSVLDFIIVLGIVFFEMSLVNHMKHSSWSFSKEIQLSMFVVLVFVAILYDRSQDGLYKANGYGFFEQPSLLCASQLLSGKIQDTSHQWDKIFNYLENAEAGEDVIVPVVYPTQNVIKEPFIDIQPDWWTNYAIRDYYGLNSLYASPEAAID